MSFASSSASMLASSSGRVIVPQTMSRCRRIAKRASRVQVRNAATAVASQSLDHIDESHQPQPHSTSTHSSSSQHPPFNPRSNHNSNRTISSREAQEFFSDLLHLPPNKQFSESLSLQILTHKSYRFVHAHRRPFSPSTFPSPTSTSTSTTDLRPSQNHDTIDPSCAPHNSRLSFIGRRAIASYLSMFVHSNITSTKRLGEMDFLRGKSLDEKLEGMRHVVNIGREVGSRWGLGEVVRWDHNETTRSGGPSKITGMSTEATLGALFLQHGSPASHRAFHLLVLPHLARQFRDLELIEAVERVRRGVEEQGRGGVLIPGFLGLVWDM